ncbi:hypothetical protein [Rhodocyclus tenuis]|uniref:DUF2325 domain-containing protein n=1 Tax=Rhodocyclus tenuis TaxID=1066 RepID=A0A840FYQ6_RHOTE|nr:hypothetical protein [Rhodocyclus tenuis]MBB4246994.1 hypothetical protein [Rhodocyclus tenuis]
MNAISSAENMALATAANASGSHAEITRLRAQLARERWRRVRSETALRTRIEHLQQRCDQLRLEASEATALRQRLQAFESGEVFRETGRRLHELEAVVAPLREAAQQRWHLEKALREAHREALTLAAERDRLASECAALAQLHSEPVSDCSGNCDQCVNEDSTRCLLYLSSDAAPCAPQLVHYRALARRLGFRLLHQAPGAVAPETLPALLGCADAVLSEEGQAQGSSGRLLQRHCSLAGKPCLRLPAQDQAAFALALAQLATSFDRMPSHHDART